MSVLEHLPRYLIAFLGPLAIALLLTPLARRAALRFGVVDHPREGRYHRSATPFLGGLAVAGGLVLVGAVTSGLSSQYLTILSGGLAVCVMGLIDDLRGVRPGVKLIVEAGAAVALWVGGVRAGLLDATWFDLPLTIVWVVGVTNALNLVDNMDGLATGVAVVSALGFFGIAARADHYLVASLALAVAGGSLGFLPYNLPPARIFLGDAGSLLLGFLLAALGLKLDLVGPGGVVRAVIPMMVLAVPLFDMAVVVAARALAGRPIYVGGTDHTSHRLASRGLSPGAVALVAIGAQAVFGMLAVWLIEVPDTTFAVATVGVFALALAGTVVFLRMRTQERGRPEPLTGLAGAGPAGRAAEPATR